MILDLWPDGLADTLFLNWMDLVPNGTVRQQQVSLIRLVAHHLDTGRPEFSFSGAGRSDGERTAGAEPSLLGLPPKLSNLPAF